MEIPLIQIDAFAERLFEGNPAAVMPLTSWLDDSVLQGLAAENNLSETAFTVPRADSPEEGVPAYDLRWFTPAVEVDLCGHATLATAAYLFADVHPEADRVLFHTRSGWLTTDRGPDDTVVMSLPAEHPQPVPTDPAVEAALGVPVLETLRATDHILVVGSAAEVAGLEPDLAVLAGTPTRGFCVTAPGDPGSGFDLVSRWFGPAAGIPEDPVTGSAHAQLAPYWAGRLGRTTLVARQVSPRGGTLHCRLEGDRVVIAGSARRYLTGTVTLD